MSIPFTNRVRGLPATVPFIGPETLERQSGTGFSARIGANESAFGISASAQSAMQAALCENQCSWYGDPENYALRAALAERLNVPMNCVCVDAGIDSLLGLAVRMFIEPGEHVVTSHGAYPTFNYHVNGFGGVVHAVPYNDNHEDMAGLLTEAKLKQARLLYFANPDNPMGTWHSADAVQSMIDEVPEQTILLIDEAYKEFASVPTSPPIDVSNKQTIRFRTFSKAYGMAGLRIGYAIAHPDIIEGFNKIRNHFAVNRLAQVGALASLQDDKVIPEVLKMVQAGRERIETFAKKQALQSLASATNFVAVDLKTTDNATRMLEALNKNGVFIRMPGVSPLNRFIRVGIGTEAEHEFFEQQFTKVLKTVVND